MAQFSVANGQIIDPSGKQFIARGINVFLDQTDASTILNTFPGINAVRLATTPSADPNAIDALVQGLTSKGVTVVIEDHSSSGGNPNTLSGQALADEVSWYAGLAGKYQGNPNVWFGTANEPDNSSNLKEITDQERAIYDGIRGTGSKAMILLEERGGGWSMDATVQNASTFANMHNVAWDFHYYGGETNGNQDPTVLANAIKAHVDGSQVVKSGDGLVPTVIGEYGPSTTGSGYDPNGLQVVQAVADSGLGSYAWAWNAGTDAVTTGNNQLTDFGQIVAKHIAAGVSTPAPTPTPTSPPPTPTPTPSPFQSEYITPGKGSFTDPAGNVYRIDAMGNADENGNPLADGSNTAAMQYANGQVYGQDATSHNWYTWNQTTWTAASAPPTPTPAPVPTPVPPVVVPPVVVPPVVVPPVVVPPVVVPGAPPAAPATDTLQLSLSEDAWQGDAQAFVTVDGKQVGGMLTVTAAHAQGKAQTISLTGSWGPGAHDVGVQFVNDAYGGTPTTDRNLYVNKLTLDGQASAAPPATLYSNGTAHLATAASPLVLQLSEDAWQGDAQFTVAVDGKTLGAAQAVTALHAKGAVQDFAFGTAMAAGTHDVAVSFLNDAYGGTAATDRNLYVSAIDANGKAMAGTTATLLSTATQHFAVVVAAHL